MADRAGGDRPEEAQGRARGLTAGGIPTRRDLWRFGGLLAARYRRSRGSPATSSHSARDARPACPTHIPWPIGLGCRLEVKDEGKPYAGFGANPTLSFKDRGMAMTVSMARSLGLKRLAVPTQGNAGDSLAEYAVAAGIEAVIVMSPDTDLPVLGQGRGIRPALSRQRQARNRPRHDHRLR